MEDRSPTEVATTPPGSTRRSGSFRRWITGGMLGLALAAVLLGGTAFAQSDSEGTDSGQSFIDRLAEKLGITSDELEATIEETRDEIIDDAVANGQLTEEQGEALKERVEAGPGFFRMMPGRPAFGMHAFGHVEMGLETIASELGMTTEELRDELAAGSTLSDVITEHGSTVDEIVVALVAMAETELDEAVASGDLTQEQADRILENLPERLTQMIQMSDALDCDRWFNDDENSDGGEETSSQV